jgi:hypothetical protein
MYGRRAMASRNLHIEFAFSLDIILFSSNTRFYSESIADHDKTLAVIGWIGYKK